MNNLPEIKDIHIPDAVSVFPLAYGWWVIIAFIIALFFLIKIVLFIIKTSKKHYALKELKSIDVSNGIDAVINISNLLRRICIGKYPEASSLYGKDWVEFLTKKNIPISKDAASLLIYAPFMDKNTKKYKIKTIEEIKDFCKKWIGDNL